MPLSALLLCLAALAQDPADDWRTLSTGHFRVHYPAEAEAWVLEVAPRYEALHAQVVAAVGHDPKRPVDVVVMDPYAMANGFALPSLGTPRIGVFPSPPDAGSGLGHFSDWSDELIAHEDTHMVHLTIPARNPLGALFTQRLLGFGPVALETPLWAVEGFAVHMEGKLTGEGRPHGAARAVYLRNLARAGRLPAYGELSGSSRWGGGALPYLVGSAFVEWLVAREGEASLRDLWMRTSSRKIRRFAEAFKGVYGERPEVLYARFSAELTQAALELEAARPATPDTLWEDLTRSTGAPAVSADGARLAVVVDQEQGPPVLRVLATAANAEAMDAWEAEVAEVLARDPLDVAPKKPAVFPHEVLERWRRGDRAPRDPRWLPDDTGLLFTAWVVQPSGDLLPELFSWVPGEHHTRRVTRGAGVQDADPAPDGTWAVAVQQRWGRTRLVRVALSDGAVSELTPSEVGTVLDSPRLAPGGQRLVFLRHRGAWEVVLRELSTGAERTLPMGPDQEPMSVAWAPDGASLLLTLAQGGFVEIARLPLTGGPPVVLTRSAGAALAPAPTPDGAALYYLSPDSEGYELHQAVLGTPPEPITVHAEPPVVPLPPGEVAPLPDTPFAESPHPYGLGRAELRPVVGAATARGASTTQVGLRLGDVIGRWELLGQAGLWGEATPVGGALTGVWRGWPVSVQLDLFGSQEQIDDTSRRLGGAITLGKRVSGDARVGELEAGLWLDRPWGDDTTAARGAAFLDAGGAHRWWAGTAWLELAADLHGQQGRTGSGAWQLGRGEGQIGLGIGPVGLLGSAGLAHTSGTASLDLLRLGGIESPLLPAAWQASRVFAPGVAPGSASGESLASWRGAFDIGGAIDLYVERQRLWDGAGLTALAGAAGSTAVGLELRAGSPSRPLVKLPGLTLTLGVACMPEDPVYGWAPKPCRGIESWSFWTSLLWRPERPVMGWGG